MYLTLQINNLGGACLSLTTLAFAKQSEPELMRMTKMPGVLMDMGY